MIKTRFGLKIRKHPRLIPLDVKNSPFYIKTGDLLVVDTNRGEELGIALKMPKGCERHAQEGLTVQKIIRKADPADLKTIELLPKQEHEVLRQATSYIKEHAVDIKIITCELLFNKKKLIIYFQQAAEDDEAKKKKTTKPNLKQLNKDFYTLFCLPVELRETGTRGEAKVLGGLGHCGNKLCCAAWLPKARHVSVKMAKEQSLAINIPKLSGVCNKLLCCLEYEHGQYHNGQIPDICPKVAKEEEDNYLEYAKMFKEKEKNQRS